MPNKNNYILARERKYVAKKNVKRAFKFGGVMASALTALGVSISIPVYLQIKEMLKAAEEDIFDLHSVILELARKMGMSPEQLYDVLGSEGFEFVYREMQDGRRQLTITKPDNSQIIIIFNPDGSVASAGNVSGPAAIEIINIINGIKDSLGEQTSAIDGILDSIANEVEWASIRIEAQVLESIIRSHGQEQPSPNNPWSDVIKYGEVIQTILIRNIISNPNAAAVESNINDIINNEGAFEDVDYYDTINADNIDQIRTVAEWLRQKAIDEANMTDEEREEASGEINDAIQDAEDAIAGIEAEKEGAITDGANDAASDAINDAIQEDESLIDQIIKIPTSWMSLYIGSKGYHNTATGAVTEPSDIVWNLVAPKLAQIIEKGETTLKEITDQIDSHLVYEDDKVVSKLYATPILETFNLSETDKYYGIHIARLTASTRNPSTGKNEVQYESYVVSNSEVEPNQFQNVNFTDPTDESMNEKITGNISLIWQSWTDSLEELAYDSILEFAKTGDPDDLLSLDRSSGTFQALDSAWGWINYVTNSSGVAIDPNNRTIVNKLKSYISVWTDDYVTNNAEYEFSFDDMLWSYRAAIALDENGVSPTSEAMSLYDGLDDATTYVQVLDFFLENEGVRVLDRLFTIMVIDETATDSARYLIRESKDAILKVLSRSYDKDIDADLEAFDQVMSDGNFDAASLISSMSYFNEVYIDVIAMTENGDDPNDIIDLIREFYTLFINVDKDVIPGIGMKANIDYANLAGSLEDAFTITETSSQQYRIDIEKWPEGLGGYEFANDTNQADETIETVRIIANMIGVLLNSPAYADAERVTLYNADGTYMRDLHFSATHNQVDDLYTVNTLGEYWAFMEDNNDQDDLDYINNLFANVDVKLSMEGMIFGVGFTNYNYGIDYRMNLIVSNENEEPLILGESAYTLENGTKVKTKLFSSLSNMKDYVNNNNDRIFNISQDNSITYSFDTAGSIIDGQDIVAVTGWEDENNPPTVADATDESKQKLLDSLGQAITQEDTFNSFVRLDVSNNGSSNVAWQYSAGVTADDVIGKTVGQAIADGQLVEVNDVVKGEIYSMELNGTTHIIEVNAQRDNIALSNWLIQNMDDLRAENGNFEEINSYDMYTGFVGDYRYMHYLMDDTAQISDGINISHNPFMTGSTHDRKGNVAVLRSSGYTDELTGISADFISSDYEEQLLKNDPSGASSGWVKPFEDKDIIFSNGSSKASVIVDMTQPFDKGLTIGLAFAAEEDRDAYVSGGSLNITTGAYDGHMHNMVDSDGNSDPTPMKTYSIEVNLSPTESFVITHRDGIPVRFGIPVQDFDNDGGYHQPPFIKNANWWAEAGGISTPPIVSKYSPYVAEPLQIRGVEELVTDMDKTFGLSFNPWQLQVVNGLGASNDEVVTTTEPFMENVAIQDLFNPEVLWLPAIGETFDPSLSNIIITNATYDINNISSVVAMDEVIAYLSALQTQIFDKALVESDREFTNFYDIIMTTQVERLGYEEAVEEYINNFSTIDYSDYENA